MSERKKLERRHIGDPDHDVGMTRCLDEDKEPNCRSCHGPWFYCSKTGDLLATKEGNAFGLVGCNRGKAKQ